MSRKLASRASYKSTVDAFNEAIFVRCKTAELKFCIKPRKCYVTGKNIWMKKAYIQYIEHYAVSGLRIEHRCYSQEAFIVERLKGNV